MSTSLQDRITALVRKGETEHARVLAREVVRNTTDLTVDVEKSQIVVETPLFRGEHDLITDADKYRIDHHGTYRYTGEGPDFTFTVHVLNETIVKKVEAKIGPEASFTAYVKPTTNESSMLGQDTTIDPDENREGETVFSGWLDRIRGLIHR